MINLWKEGGVDVANTDEEIICSKMRLDRKQDPPTYRESL
jgi:hypothetical protein